MVTNIQSPGIRQIPNQTTIKREIPHQSQGQGQPDKRPRLQQQRPNQSGAPIQQQQQNYQNKPTGVRPQQQTRNQNGQQIPIAKNQRYSSFYIQFNLSCRPIHFTLEVRYLYSVVVNNSRNNRIINSHIRFNNRIRRASE